MPVLVPFFQSKGLSLSQLGFTKSLAEGLGALFGGLLAMWSFDIMVLVQSLFAWICLWMAVLVVEPPVDNVSTPGVRVVSTCFCGDHVAADPGGPLAGSGPDQYPA